MVGDSNAEYRKGKTRIISGILFFSIFFSIGVMRVEAAPIKILNNSSHACGTISNVLTILLGRSYTSSEFIVHCTSWDSTFASISSAFNASATYYDTSGVAVPSQAPYHMYSNSFSGYPGDSVSVYNVYASYDFIDNYAFQNTASLKMPPSFRAAPGGCGSSGPGSCGNYTTGAGVEWKVAAADFGTAYTSLSGMTAFNAAVMAWLRFNHPTWNWFDVKAAIRQGATNYATGYNSAADGFGTLNATTTNALIDGQILLQPPAVATSTSGIYSQITFTVYPFRQTRRVKEVLFQFASNPGFQASELTLAEIQTLGGTKIIEYTGTTATTTAPISSAVSNAYFVWFTADNGTDSAANFSRIDTYAILGPLSQNEAQFTTSFNISSPANNAVSATPSPTFTWGAAGSYLGISKYQLFIDGALDKDNITGTSATPTSNLSEGTHTWYVKAWNGGGAATTTTSTPTININSAYTSGYNFYVDNVLGSDNNPGTQALPWATLSKAGLTAIAGDTVVIIKNAGQPYRETLTPANAGTSGLPIIFRGVDVNSKPEIWGSTDISGNGWSAYGGGNPNTYQKALAAYPNTVVVGSSIGNLSKRIQQASNNPSSLAPGEWAWSGNLYYRLNSGEDINTLHIEAAQRNTGIIGRSYNTYKDLVVRYVNSTGVSIPAQSIGERLEIYDSGTGVILSGSGSSASAPGPTLRYSVFTGNTTGISLSFPSYARVYNNISYGNSTGIDVQLWAHDSIFRNNIFDSNTSYDVNFSPFGAVSTNFIASHNNWSGTISSSWQDTYQGTNNQATLPPLLIDAANRNFRLQQFSPNVDAGTAISGLTTDILGNPIYGTPDIGSYEYQPPYQITTEKIPLTGSIRLYKDGKYRMTAATSSTATANMTINPEGGFPSGDYSEFLNVTINSWNTSGDYSKSWTESSSAAGTTVHTVGDLAPNAFYAVSVDGTRYAQFRADSGGQGTFTYSGGYSTHTFSIAPDLSIGNGPPVGLLGSVNTQSTAPSISAPGTSSSASSTTLAATSTPPTIFLATTTSTISGTTAASTSSVVIKEQIAELQIKLTILLKQLVVLLTEQLQNVKKAI